jgi:serine/threonine protein kinase
VAIHKATGEKVAVKVIDKRKFFSNVSLRKDQLKDEIVVMSKFIHPNILRLKDCFETEETLYMVME